MPTYGIVNADALNFRAGPGLSAEILAVLRRGTVLEVLADSGADWVQARLDSGLTGYVAKTYLTFSNTPSDEPLSTQKGEVTASALNVRAGPGTQYAILTVVNRGNLLDIYEREGDWLRVRANNRSGWVAAQYVRLIPNPVPGGYLSSDASLFTIALDPARRIPAQRPASNESVVAGTWNRYGGLIQALGDRLRIPTAAIVAVLAAESNGEAFAPDGRMIIRFENHIFYRYWGAQNRARFDAHFAFDRSSPANWWRGHQWRPDPSEQFRDFHGNQGAEWQVFIFAQGLDETAAMLSISMGAPQIMGFNFKRLGYETVQAMFAKFASSAHAQILGVFDFVKGAGANSPALMALQNGDYLTFASFYNGTANAPVYSERMARYKSIFDRLILTATR